MNTPYRLCWRNAASGCDGYGEYRLTRDQALVELRRCERDCPELVWWAEREDGERLTAASTAEGRT